jgi:hypothetical protein
LSGVYQNADLKGLKNQCIKSAWVTVALHQGRLSERINCKLLAIFFQTLQISAIFALNNLWAVCVSHSNCRQFIILEKSGEKCVN